MTQSLFHNALKSAGSLGLGVLLFLVPYVVDVAYYGDSTPTHYAQANVSDGEEVLSYNDLSGFEPSFVNGQLDVDRTDLVLTTYVPSHSINELLSILSHRYLVSFFHIFRPPPIV